MNCDEVNRLLDLLMDGELTDEQRLELERHGRECPECAASIRETMQLKALMADMEPEVDVPLAAQAAWRNAVREEARQGRTRRFRRWAASAAAALVVLVGVGLAMNLRGAPKQDATAVPEVAAKLAYEAEEADEAAVEAVEAEANSAAYVPEVAYEAEAFDAAESAVVETDGATSGVRVLAGGGAPAMSDAEARRTPACELSLRVADVDTACQRVLDLVEEYEGAADVQRLEDGGANLYVEVPSANAADLLTAALPLDTSGQEYDLPEFEGEGTTLVLVTLVAED